MARGRRWIGAATALAAAVVAGGTVTDGAAGAASDPVARLERTLLTRYPAVAGPLLGSSPYRSRALRVLHASGAVGVWFQARADRRPVCVAARANSVALRNAITGQIMPSAGDVRFWAARGVSPARGVDAYRRGILRACAIRGG